MVRYTDNKPQKRHAILAFNMKSGGGFEVWQYTSRKPVPANFDIQLGDLGIFVCKIKAPDVQKAYNDFRDNNVAIAGGLTLLAIERSDSEKFKDGIPDATKAYIHRAKHSTEHQLPNGFINK